VAGAGSPHISSFIDLQTGEGGWLKVIRWILFLLALTSLLLVETSWVFKALSLAALSFTLIIIHLTARRGENFNRIRLYRDGMVTLITDSGEEVPAVLEGTPWATNWVSVLPVGRFDRWPRQQLLVCRSTNHPDDYRHLLNCLRLGNLSGAADGILGPR